MSKWPNKVIKEITIDEVSEVRKRNKFVPGFTENNDPTHLTTTFLGMTALCDHYPVHNIGESPSQVWCEKCLKEAEGR